MKSGDCSLTSLCSQLEIVCANILGKFGLDPNGHEIAKARAFVLVFLNGKTFSLTNSFFSAGRGGGGGLRSNSFETGDVNLYQAYI